MPATESLQVDHYDYVIVGAGSSGCVLAARLAENPGVTVAVLEAGRRRWPKITAIPAAVVHTVGRAGYDWQYMSEPDASREGRSELWPRGKGPGGSSLINGMIFVRGHPDDFDGWARAGATGWSYSDVLPSFRRLETAPFSESQTRGVLGPQTVSNPRYRSPFTKAFIAAAGEIGLPYNPDYNDGDQEGVSYIQGIQKNGRRESAFDAFLQPRLTGQNLNLIEGALARRILFENRRAVGVEFSHGDTIRVAKARRLVVLSGGVFNSPQLLMLSGIGPASDLKAMGIEVVHDAPEVGANLMEHVGIGLQVEVDMPTLNQEMTPFRMALNLLKWAAGSGPATATVAHGIGFARTQPGLPSPDVQLQFTPIGLSAGPKGIFISNRPLITLMPTVNFPKSRGYMKLASLDPSQHPKIFPRLLDAQEDLDTLARGIDLSYRIFGAPALAKHVVRRLDPPPGDPIELEAYIRARAVPIYHPVGTCRMGSDVNSVISPDLRVRGVDDVAVADSSIMPRHISGNTHASSMMIGERAAELFTSTAAYA
jgi:choline dehydrogenase